MKTCAKCGKTKPLRAFETQDCGYIRKDCNTCIRAAQKARRDLPKLPVGISRYKGKYRVRGEIDGSQKTIGRYDTLEEAIAAQSEHYSKRNVVNEFLQRAWV